MDLKQKIENALSELYQIIDEDHSEHDLQKWFEKHPIALETLGYVEKIIHPSLVYDGEEYIPDFMVQNQQGLWEIIEIKTADANILKNTKRRHAFYSSMDSHLSQCREYTRSFIDTTCRNKFNNDYKTNCHKTPDITIIIGRNDGYDKFLAHELLSNICTTVKLVTYDDIANILISRVEEVSGQTRTDSSGLFSICAVTILPTNTDETQYILDICKRDTKNRVQLFISENRIHVIATDDNGETVNIRSTEEVYRRILGVHLEFCVQIENHDNNSSIEVLIDGELICESRTRGIYFDFSGELDMVIGSDQNGHEPSLMLMGGNITLQATPALYEKWTLRNFLFNIKDEQGNLYVHEYIGQKFMHNCGHRIHGNTMAYTSDLIQEEDAKKPILRYLL
jgi:hypothetical protein